MSRLREQPTTAGRARRWWTARRRDQLAGYLFITPQILGTALFVIAPLVMVAWYSLHEWNVLAGSFEFVGDANYRQLLDDPGLPACSPRPGCSRWAWWC